MLLEGSLFFPPFYWNRHLGKWQGHQCEWCISNGSGCFSSHCTIRDKYPTTSKHRKLLERVEQWTLLDKRSPWRQIFYNGCEKKILPVSCVWPGKSHRDDDKHVPSGGIKMLLSNPVYLLSNLSWRMPPMHNDKSCILSAHGNRDFESQDYPIL
jgi:hypothetical protein